MTVQLSIVIPAKNEQGNVLPLLTEIKQAIPTGWEYEVIYIDDGSTDGTLAELREAKQSLGITLHILRHTQSTGQSTAIYDGVQYAQGDYIITLDADGQNDPADIPRLLDATAKQYNRHFCIAGYRKARKDTWSKRVQSRIANRVRAKLLGDDTPDTGCGLKLIPRSTFLQLPYFSHMHRFLPALIKRMHGDIVVVEVNHRPRNCGQSNYTLMSRLWVGIVDLFGVMWLNRRSRYAKEVIVDGE